MMRFSLALLILAPSLFAHDFWIEPSSFHPGHGSMVAASLRVGEDLEGDPVPRIPTLLDRFVLSGSSGDTDMSGVAGSDPAGSARIGGSGLHWIGYQSNGSPVTLEAKKFEQYLAEEGLEPVIAARARSGQSDAPGRERFYRCAKSLVHAPGESSAVFERPLGFTLELTPRKNPYALRAGRSLPLSLTYRGKPVRDVLVVARSRTHPERSVRARTDRRGHVTLKLADPGFWLINAVYMDRAPATSDTDWQSWWASLTFDLPK